MNNAVGTLPGPTFAAGIQLATGVHRTDVFAVAQVLAFHVPPPRQEQTPEIAAGMRAIAASLGLGAHDGTPPYIGRPITLRRGTPVLDYGHPDARLWLPVGDEWRKVAENGGPVRILILFDPLWPTNRQGALAEHVHACYDRGAMQWGTTYL
ncbi:hypothetical protein RI578_22630 [Streptomyces sp. BB1-1-1]|uniref:hypothetical protein n=1 Tax=Streptomyces sp. BB1-1-1 TaxID=3074430 RepID=UPI002877E7F5|nr:hypothetical protein [Streptomyces sp. BB1-1-1]WND36906.1 hypothetical protein RI578_22630 [Streptomyces sp. BB1-1-1]